MKKGNLQKLRELRNEKVAAMESIISASEGDLLSEEQTAEFDSLEAEVQEIDATIERLEKLEQRQAALEQARPSVGERQLVGERERRPGPAPGPEADREFSDFGEFMYAVRFRPSDPRLEWHDSIRSEHRMDDGPSGGFAVPTQFRPMLLEVPTAPAAIRPRATVIPAGTPPDAAVTMPALDQRSAQNMYGGVTVNWIAEGGAKPATDAKIREVSLQPQEVAAHIVVTDKLLRNWQASGAVLTRLLRDAGSAAEDDKFINGTGVGTPKGFLKSAAILKVNRAGANAIAYDDLVAMEGRIFRRGAQPVWLTSGRRSEQLRKLTSPEGQFVWNENARVGLPPTLLGYPVIYVPRVPALGSLGDITLADLSYYLIKDGSGPFVATSEHVHFTDNKTVIKYFWNVDGQMWLTEPITDENGEQYSPIVTLDVP